MAGHTSHVVEVNEVTLFATGRGADRWARFLIAHRNTGRITEVAVCIAGAIRHVACDSREHAEWLAKSMVDEHGLPKSAVKRGRYQPAGTPEHRISRRSAAPEQEPDKAPSSSAFVPGRHRATRRR